jgi:hypothetical protein
MLVPPQFPALVPSQQSDDVVLNADAREGRGGEMAEIMDAQSIDACKLRYRQAGRDYSKIDPNPSFYRFCKKSDLPPDKHFLANAMFSPVANTTFSALIMLTHYQLSELHLEVWRRLYAMQEAGKPVQTNDHFRLLSELAPTLQESVRFPGTVRVIVVENRHARVPFPEDLFHGPFDQRWGWHDDWCGPMWIPSRYHFGRIDLCVQGHVGCNKPSIRSRGGGPAVVFARLSQRLPHCLRGRRPALCPADCRGVGISRTEIKQ